ncbi:hypothetical protein HB662_19750 [Roseomonas frigidaquae]|uniref:Secreted protein n=1 Tax=Falsiroseomonas frigidaquae TaxID=487318 RepID=A0ABX1F417_9PROT|nr:hypothetical protein [Falsiroseomonas frigidaquae]NKE47024.1 hypothetical protein [Falsiroseomonas frigidaquae]
MAKAQDITPKMGRRTVAAAAVGLALPAAATAPPPALLLNLAAPAQPAALLDTAADAQLIERLGVYLAAVVTYNTAPGDVFEAEEDPLWQAVQAASAAVKATPPRSLAGIVALARVAVALASHERSEDGGWSDRPAGDFAQALTLDLLRLYGAEAAA